MLIAHVPMPHTHPYMLHASCFMLHISCSLVSGELPANQHSNPVLLTLLLSSHVHAHAHDPAHASYSCSGELPTNQHSNPGLPGLLPLLLPPPLPWLRHTQAPRDSPLRPQCWSLVSLSFSVHCMPVHERSTFLRKHIKLLQNDIPRNVWGCATVRNCAQRCTVHWQEKLKMCTSDNRVSWNGFPSLASLK